MSETTETLDNDPLDAEFEFAVALFRVGKAKKGIRVLKKLANRGHWESIWELFNLAINESNAAEAKKLKRLMSDDAMNALMEAMLIELESGFDAKAYEAAFEMGQIGAAIALAKHYIASGDADSASIWHQRAQESGVIDPEILEETLESLRTLTQETKKLVRSSRQSQVQVRRTDPEAAQILDEALELIQDRKSTGAEELPKIFRVPVITKSEVFVYESFWEDATMEDARAYILESYEVSVEPVRRTSRFARSGIFTNSPDSLRETNSTGWVELENLVENENPNYPEEKFAAELRLVIDWDVEVIAESRRKAENLVRQNLSKCFMLEEASTAGNYRIDVVEIQDDYIQG